MSGIDLENYVDVAERITIFRDKFPGGSLGLADPSQPYRLMVVNDITYVVVVATAHRTADDIAPGIGMAQEMIPGATPFTRGSEIQNAQTAAWGRAIVAALAADTNRGVASRQEVQNRRAEQAPTVVRATDAAWIADFDARLEAAGTKEEVRQLRAEAQEVYHQLRLTDVDVELLDAAMKNRAEELTVVPA